MKYKTGDIVIKTSGGNKMTIERFENDLYKCVWFVESKLYEGVFEEDELVTIDEYRKILKVEERDDKINKLFNEMD